MNTVCGECIQTRVLFTKYIFIPAHGGLIGVANLGCKQNPGPGVSHPGQISVYTLSTSNKILQWQLLDNQSQHFNCVLNNKHLAKMDCRFRLTGAENVKYFSCIFGDCPNFGCFQWVLKGTKHSYLHFPLQLWLPPVLHGVAFVSFWLR